MRLLVTFIFIVRTVGPKACDASVVATLKRSSSSISIGNQSLSTRRRVATALVLLDKTYLTVASCKTQVVCEIHLLTTSVLASAVVDGASYLLAITVYSLGNKSEKMQRTTGALQVFRALF